MRAPDNSSSARKSTRNTNRRFVCRVLTGLLWVCVAWFGMVGYTATAESDSRLQRESVHVLGGSRAPVVRWYRDVKVALIGELNQTVHDVVRSVLDDISLLTGLHYQIISHDIESARDYVSVLNKTESYDLGLCESDMNTRCANFVVVLSDRVDMGQIARAFPLRPVFQRAIAGSNETLCFFSPGIYRHTEIVSSLVYVDSALDDAMQHTCLREEIFQSFGLFGDYSDSRYFSFNNVVKPKVITAYDKRLLSSLYDRAFPQGTFAAPVARQLAEYCEPGCR